MKKIITLGLKCLFLTFLILPPLYAADSASNMVNASDQIQNLDKVLTQVKQESKALVLFPSSVPKPKDGKKYYANRDATTTQNGYIYWINVDYTAECNGIKVCNVGNMTARKAASFEKFTDMKNKNITTEVTLTKAIKGYYTPGHPMADYFPANIQWMIDGTLYSLTWSAVPGNPEEEKSALLAMANSAIIGAGSAAVHPENSTKAGNPLSY